MQPGLLGPPWPCEMGLCPTAEIQHHLCGCCSKSSTSLSPTKLALLSYFPKHLNPARPRQHSTSQPNSRDLLLAWDKPSYHQTFFPPVCCFRPAEASEGKLRHWQSKPCFIWRMKNNLMVLVESWEMCCIYSWAVLGEACWLEKQLKGQCCSLRMFIQLPLHVSSKACFSSATDGLKKVIHCS